MRIAGRAVAGDGIAPLVGARVVAKISLGAEPHVAYDSSGATPVGSVAALTDRNGRWVVDLLPNSLISPPGTAWHITITRPGGGVVVDGFVDVPASGGPYQFSDVLADEPSALPSKPLRVHSEMTHGAHGLPAESASLVDPSSADEVLIRDASSGKTLAVTSASRILWRMLPTADASVNTSKILSAVGDGERVELIGGSWPVGRIQLPSRSRMSMSGATLIPVGASGFAPLSVGSGVSDVRLYDVVVDASGTHAMAMQLSSCSDVLIEGGALTGALTYGLRFDDVVDVDVIGLRVFGCGSSALGDAGVRGMGNHVSLIGVDSSNNDACGFRIQSSVGSTRTSNLAMSSCRAKGNYWHGFSGGPSPDYGVSHVSLSNCAAVGNLHNTSQGSGFNMSCISHLSMVGCHAQANGEHGIVLQDLEHASVIGCHSTGHASQGLRIQSDFSRPEDSASGVRHAFVSGCHIVDNANSIAQASVEGPCVNVRVVDSSFVGGRRPFAVIGRSGWTDPENVLLDRNYFDGGSVSNSPTNSAQVASFTGSNWESGTLVDVGA